MNFLEDGRPRTWFIKFLMYLFNTSLLFDIGFVVVVVV